MKKNNKMSYIIATLGILFYFPIITFAQSATTTIDIINTETATTTATSTPKLPTLAESEAIVRKYFVDDPIMITIAKCESGFRQYNNNDAPLIGHGLYVGVFQIDQNIHAEFAKSLGMDIYTLDGNLAYAKRLKNASGTRPWANCARQSVQLTLNLKLGMENKQVKTLQQLLNKSGYTIAKSGVGSADNETTYFGSLTRAALRRFQCDKKIVCGGTENTTGYGLLGPKTRAALINNN